MCIRDSYFAEQRQFNLRMQANGVNFDQYLKVQGQTVEEFRAWLHAEAERKLRSRMGLLLSLIHISPRLSVSACERISTAETLPSASRLSLIHI